MEKITIETIVSNFKNEVEMNNSIYVTPNEKDIDGFFFEDSTDDVIHNLVVREKVDKKYNQTFKDNYQHALHFKNTKNVFVLKYITKSLEADIDFSNDLIKLDYEQQPTWKMLDYVLRNSYFVILEVMKKNL